MTRAEQAEVDATRYERMLGRAEAEVARMRPVVDAAGAYRDFFTKPYSGTREMLLNPLIRAVDTYRATEKEAGRG